LACGLLKIIYYVTAITLALMMEVICPKCYYMAKMLHGARTHKAARDESVVTFFFRTGRHYMPRKAGGRFVGSSSIVYSTVVVNLHATGL
jgi:hypothetical protein